jgi:hypothetical protein
VKTPSACLSACVPIGLVAVLVLGAMQHFSGAQAQEPWPSPECLEHFPCPDDVSQLAPGDTLWFLIHEGYQRRDSCSSPSILLSLRTSYCYGTGVPCEIKATLALRSDSLIVDVDGVGRPDGPVVFEDGPGPAAGAYFIDAPPGRSVLRLSHGLRSDLYDLLITDALIRVSPYRHQFTTPMRHLTWRVPRYSLAVDCGGRLDGGVSCKSFLDGLERVAGLRRFSFPDSGMRPWYARPGTVAYFSYYDTDAIDRVKRYIAEHSGDLPAVPQGPAIDIRTWDNCRFWYQAGSLHDVEDVRARYRRTSQ